MGTTSALTWGWIAFVAIVAVSRIAVATITALTRVLEAWNYFELCIRSVLARSEADPIDYSICERFGSGLLLRGRRINSGGYLLDVRDKRSCSRSSRGLGNCGRSQISEDVSRHCLLWSVGFSFL